MFIRYRMLAKLVAMWKSDELLEKIDSMLYEMYPRNRKPKGRCCIHKERAVMKYKTMAMMGFTMKDEVSEMTPLSGYVKQMLERKGSSVTDNTVLHVMDEACSSCVKINYEVSNLCRGCVARPCYTNCPKDAITYDKEGKAHIDHEKCISCGKCHQVCPYHAIIYMPVPCEEACPVKAISKDEFGVEHIDPEKCIYCGKCLNACPFGAIFDKCEVFDVLKEIRNGKRVIAMVAPAVLAQFGKPLEQVYGALKSAGFDDVVEVAYGAEETIRREAEELQEKIEEGQPFMTTSCCPAYVNLAKKHIPEIVKYVSSTGSPMHYTAKYAKEKFGSECVAVFIAPCASKKAEGAADANVDYVWTFRELDAVFQGLGIDIDSTMPYVPAEYASREAYNFAKTTGVFNAVKKHIGNEELEGVVVADLNKKNIALLKGYAKTGKCPGKLVEVMSCPGGCITGPCACSTGGEAARRF
ncbi:MAG: 4Fe-4S binding protein, partial [Bacteroidaceae bacterium]|nr:4Fe-4S binding protein [Bacteroidaceae bacterium]